jgi:hypothetical protein
MIRCKNIAGVAAYIVAMVHAAFVPPPYIARVTLPHAPHELSLPHVPHGFVPPACIWRWCMLEMDSKHRLIDAFAQAYASAKAWMKSEVGCMMRVDPSRTADFCVLCVRRLVR